MHPKLDVLFARRSIRAYTDQPVPDSLLTDLLEAGMAAPSAVARDPWHFIVLRSREGLDQLAAALPNGQMLKQAPAALVVCGDLDRAHDHELSFLLQDVSAAVAAQFKLPPQVIPVAGIALGWPAQQREARTRYNPACVHRERW